MREGIRSQRGFTAGPRILALGVVWGLLACASPAAEPTQPASRPPETDPADAMAPSEATEDHTSPAGGPTTPSSAGPASPPASPPDAFEEITGIPVCDEYLALYEACEDRLRPEIMAGDRRFYTAERGWLEFMAKSPEAPTLPEACTSMLTELRSACVQVGPA